MKIPISVKGEKQKSGSNVTKDFFGQCWSLHEQTDAMWRIYSPDKYGIKVRTTIGKLRKSIKENTNSDGEVFLGQVEYKNQTEIKENLQIILNSTERNNSDLAASFLFKCEEFKHEMEIRLLFVPKVNPVEDRFEYDFNPFDVFDQIMFDPRLDDCVSDLFKQIFTMQGFDKTIKKSEPYDFKHLGKLF